VNPVVLPDLLFGVGGDVLLIQHERMCQSNALSVKSRRIMRIINYYLVTVSLPRQ